jgi:hypothetical protein
MGALGDLESCVYCENIFLCKFLNSFVMFWKGDNCHNPSLLSNKFFFGGAIISGLYLCIETLMVWLVTRDNGHCFWSCLKQLELFWPPSLYCALQMMILSASFILLNNSVVWAFSNTHRQRTFCVVHQAKYRQHYCIVDWPIASMFEQPQDQRGVANGVSMSVVSVFKAIGPAFGGSL